MTTPIERAAAAIDENYNPDQAPILAAMFQDYAQAVFESIDTDELATKLWDSVDDKGIQGRLYRDDCTYLAHTIKNWLTGKDQQ